MLEDYIEKFLVNKIQCGNACSFLLADSSNPSQPITDTICKLFNFNEVVPHPNLLWLDASNSDVLTSEIRDISKFIYSTTFYTSLPKIAIIHSVDKLNIHSLNALLKPLEDLPKNTFFILTASNVKSLPATILSRCLIIRTNVLQAESSFDTKLYQAWVALLHKDRCISLAVHEFIDKNFTSTEQLDMFKNFINHLLHKAIKRKVELPTVDQYDEVITKSLSKHDLATLGELMRFSNGLLRHVKSIGLNAKSVVLIIINRILKLAL